MATTENLVFGDGGDTYSFSFPYLKTEDVRVELQEFDASQPVGDQIISRLTTQAFTIPVGNPTTIIFDAIGVDTVYQTAPDGDVRVTSTNGYPVRIRIYRFTQADAIPSTFFAGSAIRAQDLNDNFDQILYIMQEKENALISIQTGGIGDNTIPTSAIKDDAVDSNKLRDSISTDSDRAVTTNHIRDNAITTAKIATNAVTTAKLDDSSVTSAKIANNTIVNEDVNSSAGIVATKLSFTQSGTGAVARTVDSKLKDVISVKDFGAVGDGVTNDTAAIQAAIDYADSLGTGLTTSSGVGIYFPEGTYYVASTIQIPSTLDGVGLFGPPSKGARLTTDQNIVMFMVGEDLSGGGDAASSNPTYSTHFSNLAFFSTADSNNAVALQMNRTPRSFIHDCTFWNFWKAIVGHRWNQSNVDQCLFSVVGGRTNAESFIELNGVYDSINTYTPGGGLHITDCEFNAIDTYQISYGIKVNTVDGLYITQSHFTACTVASLAVTPDGSAQNNKITDIKVDNCYFDNAQSGSVQVLLGGSVGAGGLYQRINFSQCLFRGTTGEAEYCVLIRVTDAGSFDRLLKDITFDQCEFTQAERQGLYVRGSSAGYLEVSNLIISDCTFSLNNYGNNAALLGSGFNVEVYDLTAVGNVFYADEYPAATAANWILSNAATNTHSVLVSNNNFSQSNCSEVSPYRTSLAKHLRMFVGDNILPQKGSTVSESYTTTTSGYAGGTPFIGSFTLGTTEQVAVIEARIVGVSTDGSDEHIAREHRTVFKTGSGGTISRVADNLIRSVSTLPSNSYPTVVIPLNANGNAWAATTAYAAGDYVTASGNVYLCITAGTSGATAPTHTSGAALNGTARFVYVAASDNNQFAVFVSGDSGVELDWTANIKLVTAN